MPHVPRRSFFFLRPRCKDIGLNRVSGLMFSQKQQLCSLTLMCWLQSLQPPPSPLQSISPRKWWTICLLCLFCHFFLPRSLKSAALSHSEKLEQLQTSCLCKKNKQKNTYYVFSLRFLVPSDNRLQVDSTSYCVRFPVFDFGSSHGFLWLARNILSSMIDNAPMRIITLFFAWCGRIERESSKGTLRCSGHSVRE